MLEQRRDRGVYNTRTRMEYEAVKTCESLFRIIDGLKPRKPHYSIVFLQALIPNVSISFTSTGPCTLSSSNASTTASPTRSTFNGFVTPAPISHVSLPPINEFAIAPIPVRAARGIVKLREASYMKGARMNMLRMRGNVVAIVDSASRFVEM